MTTAIFITAFALFCIWLGAKIAEFITMKKIIRLKNKQIKQLRMQNLITKQRLYIEQLFKK